jgi:hypothetical protein
MHRQHAVVNVLPSLLDTQGTTIMKTFIAAATLSLISAVSFAMPAPTVSAANQPHVQLIFQGDSFAPVYTSPLTRTRAEVVAELKASQERMDYVFMGDTWVPRTMFMSERSRDEVRAEAARLDRLAALRSGESRH